MSIRIFEYKDHRYLGAIRLIDAATGITVNRPMRVVSNGLTFIQNLSGLYVIKNAVFLAHHIDEFEAAPETPAIGSLSYQVSIYDPLKIYLPRSMDVALPKDPDENNENNIFTALEVPIYNGPTARILSNWSVIWVSVFQPGGEGSNHPIPGALLRVVRTEDEVVISRGLTDQRGEALVIVPGIPITNFSTEDPGHGHGHDDDEASGSVITLETEVRIEVIVDSELPWPADPNQMETNRLEWIRNSDSLTLIQLRTGQTVSASIPISLSEEP